MDAENSLRATRRMETEMPEEQQHETHPRSDDRNEELDESPVPDPEAKDPESQDDPQAD